MLKTRVYSERNVNMHDIVTRTGEDTLPFVNEHGMFVADGLGGQAGVRVVSVAPECYEAEALPEVMYRTGLPFIQNACRKEEGEYIQYLKDNFSSLTTPEVRRIYSNPERNSLRLKKSGYFGSHAVGATLAAVLIDMPERLKAMPWNEAVQTVPKDLIDGYQAVLRSMKTECAKVTMDDSITYFGTTVSAAFFNEAEEYVDVFFLNCGDSRSYVWEQDGFSQAAEDQGRDGGMTTLVCLSELETYAPSLEFRRYQKPCMIMSMTDGIYAMFAGKNGFHSSPLRMEGFLMSAMANANSMDELSGNLTAICDKAGGIDDSNSLVMAAFGYENYEEIKAAAAKRLEDLNQQYGMNSLPAEILLEDYEKSAENLRKQVFEKLMPILKEAYGIAPVQEYCLGKIDAPEYAKRYLQNVAALNEKVRNCEERLNIQFAKLKQIAVDNYADFDASAKKTHNLMIGKLSLNFGINSTKRAQNAGENWHKRFEDRNRILDQLQERSMQYAECLNAYCAKVRFSKEEELSIGKASELRQRNSEMELNMKSIQMFIQQGLSEIERCEADMRRAQESWAEANNRAYAESRANAGGSELDGVVRQWILADGVRMLETYPLTFPYVREKIQNEVRTYQEVQAALAELDAQIAEERKTAAQNYWDDHCVTDIETLLDNSDVFDSYPGVKAQIIERLNQNEDLKKCQMLRDQQRELFGKYMQFHFRYVSDSKRKDVEKNGWL